MQIGILGGTGPAGKALAARLASAGLEVVIGSRSKDRALEIRDQTLAKWPGRNLDIGASDNAGAAQCEVVVLATAWDGATETAVSVAPRLDGKVVICMANALVHINGEFQPLVLPRGSVAASVQAACPGSLVAAALQHLPAKELGMIDHPIDSDVLICSDHIEAIKCTADIVRKIPGLRPLDAGSLANATPIEAFTAVLLELNVRYKTRAALKINGIDGDGTLPSA